MTIVQNKAQLRRRASAVPKLRELCSTAELVELNRVPNLIQKFDSDAALLPSAVQKPDASTGPNSRTYANTKLET